MLLGSCPPCGLDVMGNQPNHKNAFGQHFHLLCWRAIPIGERGRLQITPLQPTKVAA